MLRKTVLALGAALVVCTGPAFAQATAMPAYYAPSRSFDEYEFGATLSFPDYEGLGVEGLFGFAYKSFDLEVRGGWFDPGEGTDASGTLGVTGRYRVIEHTENFPLDGAVVAGLGAWLFNDLTSTALIPVGITLGRRLQVEDSQVSIVPYAEPVLLFVTRGDDNVHFGLGLGADFKLSRAFDVRLSVGFGDATLEGFALSAVWVH